jgi:hypothetical protein
MIWSDKERRPFVRELEAQGFVRDGNSRDPLMLVKTVGEREVTVQLWKDGKHRASHMLGGRGSTRPTEFWSVEGMKAAVERELIRTDHPPRI